MNSLLSGNQVQKCDSNLLWLDGFFTLITQRLHAGKKISNRYLGGRYFKQSLAVIWQTAFLTISNLTEPFIWTSRPWKQHLFHEINPFTEYTWGPLLAWNRGLGMTSCKWPILRDVADPKIGLVQKSDTQVHISTAISSFVSRQRTNGACNTGKRIYRSDALNTRPLYVSYYTIVIFARFEWHKNIFFCCVMLVDIPWSFRRRTLP